LAVGGRPVQLIKDCADAKNLDGFKGRQDKDKILWKL